ncbi:cytochrome P450 [Roridomyces roridus]|uniref:Cytochrome P450 n=1 Tax=Roridomyces roridus TaxID=1738132 RepID=A0AAD7BCT2_9AGAR|nr:cytochrome P450 [Roridomyces roridus]
MAMYTSFFALVFVACFLLWRNASRPKVPLPPGPRKLPLIGNLHDIRGRRMWEACKEWSKEYDSDIIHLNLVGTSVVFLSSLEAMETLLERRSSIYSDRPAMPMIELMGFGFLISSLRYGNEWRVQRRLMNQRLNVSECKTFRPQELTAVHALLRRLLHTPDEFLDHIRLMAGELIIPLTYGIRVQPVYDPYITLAEEGVHQVIQVVPGRFLVDFLPFLKYVPEWMPGADFQRVLREARESLSMRPNVNWYNTGEAQPCFAVDALRELEFEGADKYYTEEAVKDVAAAMYGAGADTSVSVLSSFFLAMLSNPEAQKKAQREIDEVVGKGQMPDSGDRAGMPYVAALLKEVLRWGTVAPLALLHFLTVEDEYRGYRIPANSIIFMNLWAILNDEKMYPDPHTFNPDRFLLDGKPNQAVQDPSAVFGFGRRICPGRHLADASVWLTIVSILAMFDITKPVGEDGQVIEPSYEYTEGIICAPVPFKCSIRPRSQVAVDAVQATTFSGV